jgi:hypothetical protein
VAAIWTVDEHGECQAISTSFCPRAEVRAATFEIPASASIDDRYRDIEFLAFTEDPVEVQRVLHGVAEAFRQWTASQESIARGADEQEGIALAAKCSVWADRIADGVRALSEPRTHLAFMLANRAMLWQMQMEESGRDGPYSPAEERPTPLLERGGSKRWRPFQIAFFLGLITSLVEDGGRNVHRDTVDVIWFPTGGGKTEAYLLVAAFELIRRRLEHGDSDRATAVLSRYTLRMLTTQQFQRTGRLVCALELLRRQIGSRLGTRPFSVGLWVGKSLTPNNFASALEQNDKFTDALATGSVASNPFLVDRCPACSTALVDLPSRRFGVDCGPAHFRFACLSGRCEFEQRIPMQVVDDALYAEPPSILLGTLDKFAGLAWDERPSSFFGGPTGDAPPPSLIIQDELHLISGPLGSICSPYEIAIDSIIRARSGGVGAKVIASTATIRNSREQVRGIYGRASSVFPSPIRSWDDAYFFRLEDPSIAPGRLYLGAMGQGTTTPVVSMVWTVAALLQASAEVSLPEPLRDAYWTVLAYLNSRRELGRTVTAASQEIPDRMKAIASAEDRVRQISEVMELSAQMAKDMGDAIRTLQRRGNNNRPAVDLVPCTSIVSVGVDVDRLGLMMVNGQPKLTSEYIQATSRVGRSRSAPGLVVTLYSPAKPRDRSHYEDFLAYHESFYRFVEPTSVTPYAPPARSRTLPAAIISMIRHATPHRANDQAGSVRFDEPATATLMGNFRACIRQADASESADAERDIDYIVEAWEEQAASGMRLYYSSPGRQFAAVSRSLLRDFGDPAAQGMFEAMRSVRNVDPDVPLKPVARA